MKLLLLVPEQFISELLIKLSTDFLMFTIATHVNQSTLLSFGLFRSFVTHSPVAEKSLSASIDVVLIVIKAWYSFPSLLCSLEMTHFLFTIYNRISFCAGIVL